MAGGNAPGTVAAAMVRSPAVHGPEATVDDLVSFFTDDHVHAAVVVRDSTLLSVVLRDDLAGRAPTAPASEAGRLAGRTVAPDAALEPTRRQMLARGIRRLAVVDGAGHLLGLLCLKRSGLGFCTDADVADRARERSDDRAALALSHFAGRAGDHNDRAMLGSPALAAEFARRLGLEPTALGAPEPALGTDWAEELAVARPALTAMRDRYAEVLAAGARPITALSRCAVALATLPVVARHHPGAAVVWFDAHADLNTPDTTDTGYLGGLALSGPLGLWDSGLGAGLRLEDVVLVGVRDIDPPEQDLIDRSGITVLPPGPDLAGRLADALGGRTAYVHIDCDVLEPGTVPTDYRVPGGLTLAELHATSVTIAASGVLGLEVGEFEAAQTPEQTGRAAGAVVDGVQPLLDALAGAR